MDLDFMYYFVFMYLSLEPILMLCIKLSFNFM
jgi:hypothetical protein